MEKARRFNTGKLRWSLVNYEALKPMIRALENGANKYSPHEWKLGLEKNEVLESMQRHLAAIMDGEKNDEESGLPHIGHLMANAMFYSYFTKENEENENKEGSNGESYQRSK